MATATHWFIISCKVHFVFLCWKKKTHLTKLWVFVPHYGVHLCVSFPCTPQRTQIELVWTLFFRTFARYPDKQADSRNVFSGGVCSHDVVWFRLNQSPWLRTFGSGVNTSQQTLVWGKQRPCQRCGLCLLLNKPRCSLVHGWKWLRCGRPSSYITFSLKTGFCSHRHFAKYCLVSIIKSQLVKLSYLQANLSLSHRSHSKPSCKKGLRCCKTVSIKFCL